MKLTPIDRRTLRALAGCFALALVVPAAPVHAVEEYEKFLAGLRQRGLNDMALEYLARMRTSPALPSEAKPLLEYEEGVTLIAVAAAERDVDVRTKQLDAARAKFAEFVKTQPDHPLVSRVESQMGNLLVERAKTDLMKSTRSAYAAQKDALIAASRKLFGEADQAFSSAQQKLLARGKQLPADAQQAELRRQLSGELAQVRFDAAQAAAELAKTYPDGSADAKKALQAAAAKFGEMYNKHSNRFDGLLARVHQARCLLEAGDAKSALKYALEVLGREAVDKKGAPDLFPLKSFALRIVLQARIQEKEYDQAIKEGQAWMQAASGDLQRTANGLAIRYALAKALKLASDANPKLEATQRRQMLTEARQLAKAVAAVSGGEFQDAAKQLFQELAGVAGGDEKPPTTFAEARDRGKDALEVMQALRAQEETAKLSKDEKAASEFQREAREAEERSRELLQLALRLREPATPIDDVNVVRYYLCVLDYQSDRYYDAAIMGQFLVTKYPDSAGARDCAKIAMAAWLQGYYAAAPENREFERTRMVALADFMTRRWAGQPQADDAWIMLLTLAAGQEQLDKVQEYLAKVPIESPRRGDAEMKAGQALWHAYLVASSKEPESRPTEAELDALLKQARTTLEQGWERASKQLHAGGTPTLIAASAALSLSQILVAFDEEAKAAALLEDSVAGPLTLVAAKNPLVAQGSFVAETYKVAMRAYVATQQLEKAEKAMNDLEAAMKASGDVGDAESLTRTYIVLGRDLENQIAALSKGNKSEQLEKVSRGFDVFLDRIAGRDQGNNFSSLNWVAETYYRLGNAQLDGDQAAVARAKTYFEKSAATDAKIIAAVKADPAYAPPQALLALKLRMARGQRRAGEFQAAIDLLGEILKERPSLLDVQTEAAYTYQDWGAKKPEYYALAIAGARPEKDERGQTANLIWGWNRLGAVTQRNEKYRDLFHESRYNLAKCFLLRAMSQSGSEKAEGLGRAESAVMLVARLHPDLGGGEWPKKYDRLLKLIQEKAGRPVTGLPARKPSTDVGQTSAANRGSR